MHIPDTPFTLTSSKIKGPGFFTPIGADILKQNSLGIQKIRAHVLKHGPRAKIDVGHPNPSQQPTSLGGMEDICATCFNIEPWYITAHRQSQPECPDFIQPCNAPLCFENKIPEQKHFWTTLGGLRLSGTERECYYCSHIQSVALSHRWPIKYPPKLLKAMPARDSKVEFRWPDLTDTFRDAVTATKPLGLQHIWIDSLCIIQDDADDWGTEAARMGFVYREAYVTVSGNSSGDDNSAGFLRHNFAAVGSLSCLDSKYPIFARLVSCTTPAPAGDKIMTHGWMRNRNGKPPPLCQRGWCFQERMTSRRVLHFAENECFLESGTGYICECTDMASLHQSLKAEFNRVASIQASDGPPLPPTAMHAHWWTAWNNLSSNTP